MLYCVTYKALLFNTMDTNIAIFVCVHMTWLFWTPFVLYVMCVSVLASFNSLIFFLFSVKLRCCTEAQKFLIMKYRVQ